MWRAKNSVMRAWPTWAGEREVERIERAPRDSTRRHAANWMIGVTGLASVVIVVVWWVPHWWGVADLSDLLALLPLALLGGLLMGSLTLIDYTQRMYVGGMPAPDPDPAGAEGASRDLGQTFLVAADGSRQRVDVALTREEIAAVKKMLLGGMYSVRGITPVLGDRASLLLTELHRLGILEKPRERVATRITPAGKKAVERW